MTTVPSMNAMLDPVIAATSTHRLTDGVHGEPADAPWRMAASSHGSRSVTLIG